MMLSPRRLPRPSNLTILIAAIALLGAAHALARQIGYGVGLYADSINYIAVARNLLAGDGFANYGGDPYVLYPPLYPLLLSTGLGALDPAQIAIALNPLLFGATVFAVGCYLLRRLASRPLAIWATLTLALAIPLADIASFAISEPAFILATTLALISADRYLRRANASALLWMAAFCALAWQTRYIGIAAVCVAGVALLLRPGPSIPRRAQDAAIFALITALPMAAWLLRNYLATGALIGSPLPVQYSLPNALANIQTAIAAWSYFDLPLLPRDNLALQILVSIVIASAATLLALRLFAPQTNPPSPATECRPPADRLPALLFGGFALAYLAALLASAALGRAWHGIEPRYLLPLYIPLLIVIAVALDNALAAARHTHTRLPKLQTVLALTLSAALAIWLAAQISPAVRDVARANAGGTERGFASKEWTTSDTLRHIRQNPLIGETHSNYPIMLYYHNPAHATYRPLPAGIPTGRISGEFGDPAASGRQELATWMDGAPEGAHVVWFDISNNRRYDYAAPALRATAGLQPIAELSDGVIFRVNRNYAAAPESPHQAAYQRIRAGAYGKPAAQSQYDLYISPGALTYIKEPCAPSDARARFFLHIIPDDATDLPPDRRPYGFANLDFAFPRYGVNLDGACVIITPLPPYPITRIRTGQFVSGETALWRIDIAPSE